MWKKYTTRLGFCIVLMASGCITTSYTRHFVSKDNVTTRQSGELIGTRSLAPYGKGYRTYSLLGSAIGRQYAHHKVIETLEEAFENLHVETGRTFDIAEIGHKNGGKFSPHRTHRDGLSVDIMTPMKTEEGHPARLNTGPLSLWGYCWHIDPKNNRLNGYKWDVLPGSKYPELCPTIQMSSEKEVDFDMMLRIIQELSSVARSKGGRIKYIIVAPSYVSSLRGSGVTLSTKAKIIHDDHIHIEFAF